jgi:hypothetical protein
MLSFTVGPSEWLVPDGPQVTSLAARSRLRGPAAAATAVNSRRVQETKANYPENTRRNRIFHVHSQPLPAAILGLLGYFW